MPVIKSPKGFSLTIKNRYGAKFCNEEGRCYNIDGELLASDEFDYVLYKDGITNLCDDSTPPEFIQEDIIGKIESLIAENNLKILFE